ncbi:hypothetical protein [Sulfobacillus sp. hq2]|uniref:hypothetical protein n=1 Tax=Sulfobacillus TaxID=28033 RepID=UPI000CD0974D|nr:hypothetical protein [Sulfobacillus sp. hq2]POB09663.1 hypothetical protein CO251_15785 [Sulfobacillus sp. hq2]
MRDCKYHRRSARVAPRPSAQLTADARQQLETAFLTFLYDEFQKDKGSDNVVEVENPDCPAQSRWRWILHGTRAHWWLEIQDDTIPELLGRPYYLDPQSDPCFLDCAWSPNPPDDETRPENVHYLCHDYHVDGRTSLRLDGGSADVQSRSHTRSASVDSYR